MDRCYGRALKLMPESSSLWYDLGLNYYHQACLPPCLQEMEHNTLLLLLEKALQVQNSPGWMAGWGRTLNCLGRKS